MTCDGTKVLEIVDGDNRERCTLDEFLSANEDLAPEDLHGICGLRRGQQHALSVHCGWVVVERVE